MASETNEFSFLLKPAKYGIGVFAVHDIAKGTQLRMFENEEGLSAESLARDKASVPDQFRGYCLDWGDKLICPPDFSQMSIGWYLNHSQNPNAVRNADYKWFALQDIKAGEEITIDYNTLEEPEEVKEDYYKL
ncbi:MAG TPA: SET domain-containing protein [Patescibacteria group bacterium]|nr:SET domain-containing protein [Patescibacteria group bacterium]